MREKDRIEFSGGMSMYVCVLDGAVQSMYPPLYFCVLTLPDIKGQARGGEGGSFWFVWECRCGCEVMT